MNWNRLALALGLLWLGCACQTTGESTKADQQSLAQVRAKADQGDPEAQLQLGMMYANGAGVGRDLRAAYKWHRKAAEQGLAGAQYQLGLDYANGYGVTEDSREGVNWLRKAAEQDLVDAQIDLGRAYVNGRGVLPSAAEAVRWFRKAADQGSAAGEYELGRSYLEGAGVNKDVVEGLKWLQPAADQGYALAQYRLGQCYERGEGLDKDLVQAYKWYNLAAAHDEENAADIRLSLAKVETVLSKAQVAEAQRLAREFKPASTTKPASAAGVTGSVTVNTDDNRSEVFVDGAFVGNSPAALKLTAGSHVVEVKRAGFKPYRRELQVDAGAVLNLRVELVKE